MSPLARAPPTEISFNLPIKTSTSIISWRGCTAEASRRVAPFLSPLSKRWLCNLMREEMLGPKSMHEKVLFQGQIFTISQLNAIHTDEERIHIHKEIGYLGVEIKASDPKAGSTARLAFQQAKVVVLEGCPPNGVFAKAVKGGFFKKLKQVHINNIDDQDMAVLCKTVEAKHLNLDTLVLNNVPSLTTRGITTLFDCLNISVIERKRKLQEEGPVQAAIGTVFGRLVGIGLIDMTIDADAMDHILNFTSFYGGITIDMTWSKVQNMEWLKENVERNGATISAPENIQRNAWQDASDSDSEKEEGEI